MELNELPLVKLMKILPTLSQPQTKYLLEAAEHMATVNEIEAQDAAEEKAVG